MDKKTNAETKQKAGATITPKQNAAYDQIPRYLAEKDLKNTAVVKMIINDRDRLQAENTEMKTLQGKYSEANTQVEVLKEKMKSFTALEILSTAAVASGSLMAGAGINPYNGNYILWGAILIIAGIMAKTIKIL